LSRIQRACQRFNLRTQQGRPDEYRSSDRFHVWGWDGSGWFIKQPEAYRNQWLEYAYGWVRKTDPNRFSQLPLRRFEHYSGSMTPPKGQRQEGTIKAIWAARNSR